MVCFVPAADDDLGAHAPVMRLANTGTFPPNTRFELQEVCERGEWVAPNGMRPQQRLFVVSATYRAPRAVADRQQQDAPPSRPASAGVRPTGTMGSGRVRFT